MTTKLIEAYIVDKDDLKNSWVDFLIGHTANKSHQLRLIQNTYHKIEKEIESSRWIVMDQNLFFDKKINACWLGLNQSGDYFKKYSSESDYAAIKKEILSRYKNKYLELPTKKELTQSLTQLTSAPFALNSNYKRPNGFALALYKNTSTVQGFYIDSHGLDDYQGGLAVPLIRLAQHNTFKLSHKEIFFLWIVKGLTPVSLSQDIDYQYLRSCQYEVTDVTKPFQVELPDSPIFSSGKVLIDALLQEDTIRADIKPYHEKMLEDIDQGHWSLWEMEKKVNQPVSIKLENKLVARDPKSRIIEGVVGIDFGTKSTVVAYQEDTTHTQLMRVGMGDLSKEVAAYHYENPTIMEFNDLQNFMAAYQAREGRPLTQWKDLTISHTAFQDLIHSNSASFNTFFSELKQWAGDKNRKLKVVDKKGWAQDLGSFMDLDEASINPIELYAYYLGLYINNQHNGIFMNYILSFPVTYEVEIRNKIIDSFKKGIKKSLPLELHLQEGVVDQLSVIKGASEPAAYAVIALQAYGFEPVDEEEVFYGIFDFGGGTTDFDFGLYKEANGKNQRRYDYVIEHFGAGGDRYLGGENLLELLAFEVFKANKDILLEVSMQFVLPPECRKFPGSEMLLSHSREAKMNTKLLMEKLRPFWENDADGLAELDSGEIRLNLTDTSGQVLANSVLSVDIEQMEDILINRIKKGVVNFFESLRESITSHSDMLQNIDQINIFLAGNSSKSPLVSDLFDEEIAKRTAEMSQSLQLADDKGFFTVHPPLGLENGEDTSKPTGKTGVAFGLIETRRGGKTLVIDHNTDENNINFKYYMGMNKKRKFRVSIDREEEYNKWINFIDASEDTFEIYYTSIATASTNQLEISDVSIKKKMLTIDTVNDQASVFIRLKNATEFEYVVANDEAVMNNEFLGDIKAVAL